MKWLKNKIQKFEEDIRQQDIFDSTNVIVNQIMFNSKNYTPAEQSLIITNVISTIVELKEARKEEIQNEISVIDDLLTEINNN